MKIGIIGAGNVGGALGQRWVAAGHSVKFGVRNVNKPDLIAFLKKCGAKASAGSVAEAAAFGAAVAITTPWPATQGAIESAGSLKGKIAVDCTNPLEPDLSGLTIGHTTSAAEKVAS